MSRISRRHFLQFAASTLTTLGLSQWQIARQGNRYGQVLAQSTSRKLALLVGINQYPSPISSLRGCQTDVELQSELLVHRFGFQPADILTLTDGGEQTPTRQAILEAFETHLIAQAKPGDVVVFHFSGHGSRVTDPNPLNPERLNGTILPADRTIPGEPGVVRDIMGRDLFLLMSALQTDQVTVVLDSCYSGGGTRGNITIRAAESRYDGRGMAVPSPEVLAYQADWLQRLKLSEEEFHQARRQGIARGVALGSAQENQEAADAQFSGFYAGAFTYLLTRYLWQQTTSQPLKTVFVNLARSTKDLANSSGLPKGQDPRYDAQPGSQADRQAVYFLKPPTPAAEAVVLGQPQGQIEFWLGGVSSQSLEAFKNGAIFNAIAPNNDVLAEIEQTARTGLRGYGRVRKGKAAAVKAGTLLREQVRGLPPNPTLKLGLDPSLGADLSAVRSALQSVSRVEPVAVNQQTEVHYLFGRATEAALQVAQQVSIANLPPLGSLGLLTADLAPIDGSFGPLGESAADAVQRLRSRLKLLLAGRILRLILNSDTSKLKVTTAIAPVGQRGTTGSVSSRSAEEAGIVPTLSINAQKLKAGTEIKIEITNREPHDLYMGVLAISSEGDLFVLYPTDWEAPEEAARVAQGQTLIVPPEGDRFQFIAQGPAGFLEVLVLASTDPLREALKGLGRIAARRGARSGDPIGLQAEEPVEVMDALLGDLDESSRASIGIRENVQAIDTTKLAAISAILQVVE